jgi:hypothetical protein
MEAVIVQVIVAGGVLAALVVMWGLRSSIRPSIIEAWNGRWLAIRRASIRKRVR